MINNSIFRHESEARDDDCLPTTSARVQNVVAPDDEVANGGYYTFPPMNVVASTSSVPNFIVGRKGYGTISFKSPVDLTDVSSLTVLREIVEMARGRATVYPDESKEPPPGKGLNVPAEITLENICPPPVFEGDEYIAKLKETPDTTFVSYNPETGAWIFMMDHFSSYSTIWDESSTSSSGRSSPIVFHQGNASANVSSTNSIAATPLSQASYPRSNSTTSINLRRSERLQRATSRTKASATAQPEARFTFLTRSSEAERLFKSFVKEYIRMRKPPSQTRIRKLEQYKDVLEWPLISRWMDEEHLNNGVRFDDETKKVIFIEYPGRLHETVTGEISDQLSLQVPSHTFKKVGTAGILYFFTLADLHRLPEPIDK